MAEKSVSPAGEAFPLPTREEYAAEMTRLEGLAKAARAEGKEVVVVMGVGFVGARHGARSSRTPSTRRPRSRASS